MIVYLEGNIFKSPARVLVNTVNTKGVMGKGIALEFKQRYPAMYDMYRDECKKGRYQVGKLMLWHEADHDILLFPTKEDWRKPSRLEYIEKGLRTLSNKCNERGISSLAMPMLGCGNGGLKQEDVRLLIEKYLGRLPIDVYVYLGTVKEDKERKTVSKNMSYAAMLGEIAAKYSIIPWRSNYRDESYTVSWKESIGLVLESSETVGEFTKEEIDEYWSFIREKGVFPINGENFKKRWFCVFLSDHDYLSRVRILEKKEQRLQDGFQYNAGSEWMYAAGL